MWLHTLQEYSMNFETALTAIKAGARARREVWSGAHKRSIYLVPGSVFLVSRPPLADLYAPGTLITYLPHIDVQYVDGSCGVWIPDQPDMFADDWQLFEESVPQPADAASVALHVDQASSGEV